MAALRLPIKGTDHVVFLPAAGVPWFVAPFGQHPDCCRDRSTVGCAATTFAAIEGLICPHGAFLGQ
jgi:hypothetical protein